jgi:hypothetical protein
MLLSSCLLLLDCLCCSWSRCTPQRGGAAARLLLQGGAMILRLLVLFLLNIPQQELIS